MKLFPASIAVLNAGLKAVGGEAVTYRRGTAAIDALTVVFCNELDDAAGDANAHLTGRQCDAIVWAAELVSEGLKLTPQRGDQIDRLTADGSRKTYNVLPRTGGRCYQPTDATERQLRVYLVETLPNRNAPPE